MPSVYSNPAKRKSTCGVRCGDGILAETYVTASHVVYNQSTRRTIFGPLFH
jgi:hypothetical protein